MKKSLLFSIIFLSVFFSFAQQKTQRIALYEEFTSSTCSPCASFNSSYFNDSYLTTNAGSFTLVKYQMSWPSPGDPYYTAEGGARRSFYGVNSVPQLFLDANEGTFFNTGQLQTALDNALAITSNFDISATHQINGNIISVQVDVSSFANEEDVKGHIVVVEKETTQNTGNNGETKFTNVMMKMIPDAGGTTLSLYNGSHFYFGGNADMSITNVEEISDLAIIVFLQNPTTKEIYQSAYSVEAALPLPQVSFVPTDGVTDFNIEKQLIISFNQPMLLANGDEITNTNISDFIHLTSPDKVDIPFISQINNGKTTITISSETHWTELTEYTLSLDNNEIKNSAGNLLNSASTTFNTDEYPAQIVTFTPESGSTNVEVDIDNLKINFEQVIRLIDDTPVTNDNIHSIISLKTSDETPIPYSAVIGFTKKGITVYPDNNLPPNTNIIFSVNGGLIENEYDVALSEQICTFTTEESNSINNLFSDINIYPNPANNIITLTGAKDSKIQIHDISGKVLIKKTILSNIEKIGVNNLNSGVYILRVTNSNETIEKKISIIK